MAVTILSEGTMTAPATGPSWPRRRAISRSAQRCGSRTTTYACGGLAAASASAGPFHAHTRKYFWTVVDGGIGRQRTADGLMVHRRVPRR